MSDRTTRVFTCDRCGSVVETEPNKQPYDWERHYVSNPPLKKPDDNTKGVDLCKRCVGEFKGWMTLPASLERHRVEAEARAAEKAKSSIEESKADTVKLRRELDVAATPEIPPDVAVDFDTLTASGPPDALDELVDGFKKVNHFT